MNKLLIFVDSERTDTYFNSVVHNIANEDVRDIWFVHILGLPGRVETTFQRGVSGRIMGSVQARLKDLAEQGVYAFPDGRRMEINQENSSKTNPEIRAYYEGILAVSVSYHNLDLHYEKIGEFLHLFLSDNTNYVCDVTSVRKRYLGDIVCLALVEGLNGLFTFDIYEKIDFDRPWMVLIDQLCTGVTPHFLYTNILKTPIFLQARKLVFIRAPRFVAAAGIIATLVLAGLVLNVIFGFDGRVANVINVISQCATLGGIILVFLPPRA